MYFPGGGRSGAVVTPQMQKTPSPNAPVNLQMKAGKLSKHIHICRFHHDLNALQLDLLLLSFRRSVIQMESGRGQTFSEQLLDYEEQVNVTNKA